MRRRFYRAGAVLLAALIALAPLPGVAEEQLDLFEASDLFGCRGPNPVPTDADGYPVPPPDRLFGGGPWRMLSGDGKIARNTCVGDMSRPECVVDTMVACSLWSPSYTPTEQDRLSGDNLYYHPVCDMVRSRPGDTASVPLDLEVNSGVFPQDAAVIYKLYPMTLTERFFPVCYFLEGDDMEHYGDVAYAVVMNTYVRNDRCKLPLTDDGWKIHRYRADCAIDTCNAQYPQWAGLDGGYDYFGTTAVILHYGPALTGGKDRWNITGIPYKDYRECVWRELRDLYRDIRTLGVDPKSAR